MDRWCSASSIRDNQSETGHLTLSQLAEKKCKLLNDFLSEFHNLMPPNISGVLYQRTGEELNGLMQSRFSASRMMGAHDFNGINSSYFPPSILNGSIVSNLHQFKQPLPVQRSQPEPIFNQDNLQNSMVLKSFAKINEINQASLRDLSANTKITQDASFRTNPRITQEANNSTSISLNNRGNEIRKKGFLNKNRTKQAPQPIQDSVVKIGISEREELIQEDELSDVSDSCSEYSPRKRIKIVKEKHNMPTPSTSKSSDESPPANKIPRMQVPIPSTSKSSKEPLPARKIPRMQVEEEIVKKVNIERVPSAGNTDESLDFNYIIKKWALVLVDKSLRIYGDKYNKNGSLIKRNITSGPIKAFIKKNKSFVKTQNCVYMLEGKLYDPDNAVPETIKFMCRNGDFPRFWKKALTEWIKIKSETEEVPSSHSEDEEEISTQQKAKKSKNGKQKKKPNSKKTVKAREINETNKKNVLDLMMTNDSILCTSMTPNALLNSIKKNGTEHNIFTPPSKLLYELRGNESKKSNETESDDDDYTAKINKPNPVVGRVAKVVAKPKKPQRQLKPKAKIPVETSYEEKSLNFSDLSSIEESD